MIADDGKQKTFDIHDTAMINIKKTQKKHVKQLKKKHPEEKSSKQSTADTFIFLRQKLECDKDLREKEVRKN